MLVALAVTPAAHAMNSYAGNVVAHCGTFAGFTYNLVASVTAKKWKLSELDYEFDPAVQSTHLDDPRGKTRYFWVPPGIYIVDVVDSANDVEGAYFVSASSCTSAGMGMTWSLLASNPTTGTILVGCGNSCDAYQGDTACTTALPILCILKSGPGFPLPVPESVDNTDIYDQWSGGIVGTTQAALPPSTLASANDLCVTEFGPNWRVAEFHDGWGWNFQAYGGVGNPAARFWVHVDDQSGATCWRD
jgi:hypothetical protein